MLSPIQTDLAESISNKILLVWLDVNSHPAQIVKRLYDQILHRIFRPHIHIKTLF